jgi:hypothetical protein
MVEFGVFSAVRSEFLILFELQLQRGKNNNDLKKTEGSMGSL